MTFLRRSLTGVLLIALTLGALGWAGASVWNAVTAMLSDEPRARPNREVAVSVTVHRVTPGTEVPVIAAFGEVQSARTLELRASASGRVVMLAQDFRTGGRVAAGQLLARIDPAEPRAALSVAEADLTEAEADLRDALAGLDLAEADLAVAGEQADLRAQALARQQDLAERGVGSASAVEEAALAAASARASVVSRRQALAAARARIDQGETRRTRAAIALAEARRVLDDTEIRAPFTGLLDDVALVEGGLVATNETLAVLVDPDTLEVMFRLSTLQHARLLTAAGRLPEAPVAVHQDIAGLDMSTTGNVVRESAVVDEGLTGREVHARLDRAAGFRPGDIVRVTLSEPALENVARLPARAVGPDGGVLMIGADDRLVERRVAVLRSQGESVLADVGDLAGAEIVAERLPSLGAGIKVRPLRDAPGTVGEDEQAFDLSQGQIVTAGMVELSPDRRAQLIAFVEADDAMPDADRTRVIAILSQAEVPAGIVARLEGRIGG